MGVRVAALFIYLMKPRLPFSSLVGDLNIESFQIGQTNIKCDDSVTLLGINIDYMLKFDAHVSEICKKASKQLAVLKRLG